MKVLIFTTTEEIVEYISGLVYVDEVLVLTYADPGNYQHFARHAKVRVCGSSNKQEFQKLLLTLSSDYRPISCYCPYIFSKDEISLFDRPILNLHTGKIPDNRGRSPLFWDIVENKTQSIGTLHTISEEIDKGRIFYEVKVDILNNDNPATLGRKILQTCIDLRLYDHWLKLSEMAIKDLPEVIDDGTYKKGFYEDHSYDSKLYSSSDLMKLWRCHSIWGYIVINELKMLAISFYPVKAYIKIECLNNGCVYGLPE